MSLKSDIRRHCQSLMLHIAGNRCMSGFGSFSRFFLFSIKIFLFCYKILFLTYISKVKLVDNNQLDAQNFSNIFICLSLSTCFGHYVPIIRRDPIALTQLLYLSFRFSCVPCEHCSAHKVHS
jgi:hypothetical protein